MLFFFFSSRRRHTRSKRDWSSDVCSSDLPTDVTVTLIGETGTGKDVFAHLTHDLSPRVRQPFVVFDCGAVPPNLVESELFGQIGRASCRERVESAGGGGAVT